MTQTNMIGLDEYSAAELARMRKKLDSIRGDGVNNKPDVITITAQQAKQGGGAVSNRDRPAKILNTLPGAGFYNIALLSPSTTNITGTAALTASILGTEITMPVQAIFMNLAEVGAGYSDLEVGAFVDARFYTCNSAGAPIYYGWALKVRACAP